MFCEFGLTMPIHAHFYGFLSDMTAKWGDVLTIPQKGTSLHGNMPYNVKNVKIGPSV